MAMILYSSELVPEPGEAELDELRRAAVIRDSSDFNHNVAWLDILPR